ncbi:MAG: GAF domain-containing protein, partial [Candidatus Aminicenantes bacterium]
LGKHFREFFADKREAYQILRALLDKGSWRGEPLARRKNGSWFDAQLSASLVKDRTGKPIGGMASFIDITQRKQLEKVQESIYRISETASSVKNLDELYPKIYEIIRGLIHAKNFYIALYEEKDETLYFPYFIDQEDPPPQPRKREKGMTEYVLRTGAPILAPPEVCEALKAAGEIEDLGTPSIDWLGVPLKTTDNKTIGVLVVQTYEEGLRYTEKDKDMLVFVSTQIAMAIQRKQAEDQVKKSLEEKEALLKEIHHRVKNNLAIIYELLELQSGSFQEPKLLDFFRSSKNRIKSMALIHETLFQSEDIARIDSDLYINSLVDHLNSAFGGGDSSVHTNVRVENIPLSIDTAIPCGLIVNELVTNAFKHAFKKRRPGEIAIRLSREKNNSMTLEVSDNGIGLPPDLDIREASTIGLQLVDILVRQLEASISIERNNGTRFKINFFERTAE